MEERRWRQGVSECEERSQNGGKIYWGKERVGFLFQSHSSPGLSGG